MTALPRPLSANGRVRQRWADWQRRQRAAVMYRCRGRCEAPDCRADAREAHHCFGRRNVIGEPLASHRAMLAGLCTDCHRRITVEPGSELAVAVQQDAITRAAWMLGVPASLVVDGDPVDVARYIERTLIERGEMVALRQAAGL